MTLRIYVIGLCFGYLIAAVSGCSRDSESETQADNNASFDLQASVSFKDGDTRPVTSTHFYVLKHHVFSICRDAGMENFGYDESGGDLKMLEYVHRVLRDKDAPGHEQLVSEIKKATAAEFETDMNGLATVTGLRGVSSYYIFGATEMRQHALFWNHRFNPKDKVNHVRLNANNAESRKTDE